ncbi:hypothetical protein [Nonomuraea fuscirosea]|uniref:hypothetical protein n=1 Tax=Nonomuraea fuscirosea TaxID=1291556 RepID=UPI00342C4F77
MTDPAHLSSGHTARLQEVLDCCLELQQATEHVRTFADLLTQRQRNRLDDWINEVRAGDLQPLRSFAEGLLIDHDAVAAGLTPALQQRPHRRHDQQDQTTETADVRARQFRPTPQTDASHHR